MKNYCYQKQFDEKDDKYEIKLSIWCPIPRQDRNQLFITCSMYYNIHDGFCEYIPTRKVRVLL